MNKIIKNNLFILIFFITFFTYSNAPKAEIPMGGGKYNSIEIRYQIKGEFQNGEEIFIQKNGKTYRKTKITTKIVANSFSENTLEIDDGSFFYRINLTNNTGIKLPSINKLKKEMIKKNPHLFKNKKNNPLRITPIKGALKKEEKILGHNCKAYVKNNKIYFIWNDIILKQTWEVLGTTIKTAEILKLDEEIDESFFKIPESIKFHP